MAYTYEDKINFIANLYCPARMISDQTGCSWQMILGQAALETGWGEKCLPGTNNVFNIKADASWKGQSQIFHVPEEIDGKTVWVDDPFRVYSSVYESLADRMEFLKQNPRYHRLYEDGIKGDYKKEAKELKKAKYASASNYSEQLIEIIECRSMQRAIARAQERGCAAVLPAVEVLLLDGAKVPIAEAALQIMQDGRLAEKATDGQGRIVIRITPKSGDIHLKVFDKHQEKWIDLDPIKLATPAKGTNVTLIAPTFTAHTSTREHEKTSPPKPAPQPASKPNVAGAQPHPIPGASSAKQKLKDYSVAKGDSLASIAARHGVRYQAIAKANGITSPYIIRPGQVLLIPDAPAALAAQEKQHAKSGTSPAVHDSGGMSLAVLGQLLSEGGHYLHTAFLRNAQDHPQTDLMHASRAPWMVPAQQEFEKGVKRRPGRDQNDPRILEYFTATPTLSRSAASVDETPYCAAFANWCLGRAGFHGTNSALAASFKTWGRPTRHNRPALGAIAVIRFLDGHHHVTFVAGISADGMHIATLGGNQGGAHAVSHSYCSKERVVAYRYPANYPDYDDDYVLHEVAGDHAPMTVASTH